MERFNVGDETWIQSCSAPLEGCIMRSKQVVESTMDVPTTEENSQAIYLVGLPYVFSNEDLEKVVQ